MASSPNLSLKQRLIAREVKDVNSLDLWRACLAEFLGTGLLAFLAVGAGLSPEGSPPVSSVHIALEAGFFIAAIITTLNTISGGHVNPAISLGFLLTGHIGFIRFLLYITAQTVGAIAGCGLLMALTPDNLHQSGFGVITPGPNVTAAQAFGAEVVITFVLDFTTFSFVDNGRHDLSGSIPLIIGIVVTLNIFAMFNVSGGCMNPARNFGPMVITGNYTYAWVYWLGPMVGGGLGAVLYDKVFSTQVCKRRLKSCRGGVSTHEEEAITEKEEENGNINIKLLDSGQVP
ncbi:aquaporin AQPAe.a-like [Saccostrea cucullata]|uniref:aquaporin AQPAe.a-like n=1 Tax=Saccostrea cuccullata TaxID=36930 RepID=UPI002ED18E7B